MMTEEQWRGEQQPQQEARRLLEDIREGQLCHRETEEWMNRAKSVISALISKDPVLGRDPVLLNSVDAEAASHDSESGSTQRATGFSYTTPYRKTDVATRRVFKSTLLASLGQHEQMQPPFAAIRGQP